MELDKMQEGGEGLIVNNLINDIFNRVSHSFGASNEKTGGKKGSKKGGKKTSKKTGGTIELTPILVSLIILGLRVISDSKLSNAYMKHVKKVRGGSSNLEVEFFDTMRKTGGGNSSDSIISGGLLPTMVNEIQRLIGGKKKSYKGGKEYAGVDFSMPADQSSSDYQFVETTKGGKKSRKGKKRGGNATTFATSPTAPADAKGPANAPAPAPADAKAPAPAPADVDPDCVEDSSSSTGTSSATGTGATGTGATGTFAADSSKDGFVPLISQAQEQANAANQPSSASITNPQSGDTASTNTGSITVNGGKKRKASKKRGGEVNFMAAIKEGIPATHILKGGNPSNGGLVEGFGKAMEHFTRNDPLPDLPMFLGGKKKKRGGNMEEAMNLFPK